jgi:hypothetical protein
MAKLAAATAEDSTYTDSAELRLGCRMGIDSGLAIQEAGALTTNLRHTFTFL